MTRELVMAGSRRPGSRQHESAVLCVGQVQYYSLSTSWTSIYHITMRSFLPASTAHIHKTICAAFHGIRDEGEGTAYKTFIFLLSLA